MVEILNSGMPINQLYIHTTMAMLSMRREWPTSLQPIAVIVVEHQKHKGRKQLGSSQTAFHHFIYLFCAYLDLFLLFLHVVWGKPSILHI